MFSFKLAIFQVKRPASNVGEATLELPEPGASEMPALEAEEEEEAEEDLEEMRERLQALKN